MKQFNHKTISAVNNPFPHHYIAIEGNIGAGKTTFCELLSRDFNCRLILEQFTDNPFLPLFYEQPERYAFPVELFFMTERHKQLQASFSSGSDLFTPLSIADYFFIKTLLFAKNNLNNQEFRLFKRLFEVLNTTFPKPDLLVYLHRSVEDAMRNIRKRGRDFEKDITTDYLLNIQNGYFEYFRTEKDLPILIIDVEGVDYLTNPSAYQKLVNILQQKYEKGVHRVMIDNAL